MIGNDIQNEIGKYADTGEDAAVAARTRAPAVDAHQMPQSAEAPHHQRTASVNLKNFTCHQFNSYKHFEIDKFITPHASFFLPYSPAHICVYASIFCCKNFSVHLRSFSMVNSTCSLTSLISDFSGWVSLKMSTRIFKFNFRLFYFEFFKKTCNNVNFAFYNDTYKLS